MEMTSPITHTENDMPIAAFGSKPFYTCSIEQDVWLAALKSASSGSTGIVTLIADYGLILPHVGSSSFIVDRRSPERTLKVEMPEGSARFLQVLALPVAEQMMELLAALSVNKSQLADILRVTRPTIYDWFQNREPNVANTERLHVLLTILARASVSSASPLNARFVRQSTELEEPSLVDLLAAEQLDEDRIARAIERAQMLADSASRRRETREERLRALGFEDPSNQQRREQLAKNVALRDWPEQEQ